MGTMTFVLPTGQSINIFEEDARLAPKFEVKESLQGLLGYYKQAIEQDDIEGLEKEIHRHCLAITNSNGCDRIVAESIEALLLEKFENKYDMQLQ